MAKVTLPAQSMRAREPRATSSKREVAPHRGEEPDGHGDEEDQTPVDRREQPAQQEPDERAADGGRLVDAEREAAAVEWEGVGEDGGRVGHEHGGTDALKDPHDDEPDAAGGTRHPGDAEQQREKGEDREAQVVDADAPVEVAQAAEAHHQHAGDDEEAEDHPEQEEGVGGQEGVEVDPAEDVRQGDEDDGGVDRRHEHAECRDEEGRPAVVVVGAEGGGAGGVGGPGGSGRPGGDEIAHRSVPADRCAPKVVRSSRSEFVPPGPVILEWPIPLC